MNDDQQITDPEITDFHLTSPHLQDDPHPFYARLRRDFPVARSDRFGGYWILSTYDDVMRAYREPDLFSSCPNSIPSLGQQRPVIPSEIDPPDHRHYRNILNPLFTARGLEPKQEQIHSLITSLVEEIAPKGECEFVSAFAKVVPTHVFLTVVGMPLEDGPMFVDWTERLLHGVVEGDDDATRALREETGMKLYGYFNEELDRRDAAGEPVIGPDADFLDTLRGASFAGERPLTRLEILDIVFITLLGGLDTTQGVLGFAIEHLAKNDEHRKLLATEPGVVDTAVEEFLRYFAPVAPGRRLTRDVTIRGVDLRAGDRVMLLTGSASRDEKKFDHADTVDLRRTPNPHLAFGAGIHRCLGVLLGRIELRWALREWHRLIPDYRIAPGSVVRQHVSTVAGVDELHLEWTT
jgi:cytochrome P450